jgi:hypothetical protein
VWDRNRAKWPADAGFCYPFDLLGFKADHGETFFAWNPSPIDEFVFTQLQNSWESLTASSIITWLWKSWLQQGKMLKRNMLRSNDIELSSGGSSNTRQFNASISPSVRVPTLSRAAKTTASTRGFDLHIRKTGNPFGIPGAIP